MDSEKEKEINFKPSNWLYIFLFIDYSIWLWQSYGAINNYITFGFDSFLEYGVVEWLSFALFIVAGIYSFYAVIKTLRGDKDCITSLKWSLVLLFIYTLTNPVRAQMPTYDIQTKYAVFLIRPLFYLLFYLYLCFAKGIKLRFPKSERRFGPSGWVWAGLMVVYAGVGIYGVWQQYQISDYCKRVDIASLNLKPGEVSDGYLLFFSDRKWEEWAEPEDTLYIEDRLETLPTIMSADTISQIYIASGRCDKPNARTYNQILVKSMGAILANMGESYGKLKEISFKDSTFHTQRVFSTVYETTVDSVPAYFDVMMVVEASSPKCCVVVRVDKHPIDIDWAIEFSERIKFDLQNVAKSKDEEDGNNTKDKDTHRTAYGKHQANANVLAALFHRVFPRHLFRIVTLKHYERKVCYRKCDYKFQNR